MNKELKEKWLKALRSGDYEQGRHRLRSTDNKYCCLGVLCDIHDPKGWFHDEEIMLYTMDDRCGTPHPDKLELFGFSMDQAEILMNMNDSDRKSFNAIADWIEENL